MDPETIALWKASLAGKIPREEDNKAILRAVLTEMIPVMRIDIQRCEDMIREGETIIAAYEKALASVREAFSSLATCLRDSEELLAELDSQ